MGNFGKVGNTENFVTDDVEIEDFGNVCKSGNSKNVVMDGVDIEK